MAMPERQRRKICVLLVDRANYGRLKPVLRAIQSHERLTLQVLVAGTMPLERFGRPMDIVQKDGFPIDGQVLMELEGSIPISMAKSVGFGVIEFANEFQRLDPDVVLAIGKFAHYHFPSTHRAAEYLIRMGEHPQTILAIGCPSGDIAMAMRRSPPP